MLPVICAKPECRNMLVTSGRNAPTKSLFPAREAGKGAVITALAIKKALNKCGGSEISCRKTATFAQMSSTLTIGNRRCGLRSLSGMNTESRGQSNQKQQKDKASRIARECRGLTISAAHEAENVFLIFSRNVNLPGDSSFPSANIARALRV